MRLKRWINRNILSLVTPHRASFAYHPEGGVLKAAQAHCCCNWLVKLDIKDFFDSISERHVYRVYRSLGYNALLSFELARICTRPCNQNGPGAPASYGVRAYRNGVEGCLPQGAPTSPALANIAFFQLDERLQTLAVARGWTYTRYGDDLAFSTRKQSDRNAARHLIAIIKSELRNFGFHPNNAETVIVPPGARRVVLGLLVDDVTPRLNRSFRDNLETHLYALTSTHIGPERHRQKRKFASLIGLRRHITGLLAFAHYVEPDFAERCYKKFNTVHWSV
jgi:RNA-directed DNA polymerase